MRVGNPARMGIMEMGGIRDVNFSAGGVVDE